MSGNKTGFELNDLVPVTDSALNTLSKHVLGNKSDTIAGNSAMSLLQQILVAVSEAMQLRVEQSQTGTVEEDGMVNFGIGLMDIDTGAIASASIDITSISAVLDISTGGAAFGAVGTQPTFAKANGLVSVDYRFLAGEWANGDMYKLVVSGIECTVGADTAYVPALTWSGTLQEGLNVEGKIDAIQADIGDPSARTNLQTLLALLGNPDTAGKTIYEAIKNIRETAINGASLPITNTLSDILHKNASYTYDNTTDSNEAISDELAEVPKETGTKTFNGTALQSIQDEAEDALEGEDLDHFLKLDGATQKYPENCATDSILAKIIVKADPAVPSQYDNSTDSLEAIRDNIDTLDAALQVDLDALIVAAITNAAGADVATDVVAVKAVVDTIAGYLDTEIAAIVTAVITNAAGADVATDVVALKAVADAIQVDLGDYSAQTNLQSLLAALGIPDTAAKPLYTCLVTDRLDHATFGLSAIQVQVDDIQDKIDGTDATAIAYRREYGVTQVTEFSVTANANAGVTTVTTITTQPCLIKSIVLHSDGVTTADLTSAAIKGGAAQVVEFISAATAAKANIDAANEQVSWTGAVRLPATTTIAIDLQGTGATAVDFTVTIEYMACVDDGYLT